VSLRQAVRKNKQGVEVGADPVKDIVSQLVFTIVSRNTDEKERDSKTLAPKQLALYVSGICCRETRDSVEIDPVSGTKFSKKLAWIARKKRALLSKTSNLVSRLDGGATGIGIQEQISIMYQWLSKTYLPGDKIMFFGFSRGAFSVRALNGMIAEVGLLKPEHASEARVKQVAALYSSKRALRVHRVAQELMALKDSDGNVRYPELDWNVKDAAAFGLSAFWKPDANEELVKKVIQPFRTEFCVENPKAKKSVSAQYPPVYFVGVFDTVKSHGLSWVAPVLAPRNLDAKNKGTLHPVRGCHALAISERRFVFRPLLWNEIPDEEASISRRKKFQQVWFRGTQISVGGGSPSKKEFYRTGQAT